MPSWRSASAVIDPSPTRRVLLVILDGWRRKVAMDDSRMPRMAELARGGSRGPVWTGTRTLTKACVREMLTGRPSSLRDATRNLMSDRVTEPSLMTRMREADLSFALVDHIGDLRDLFAAQSPRGIDPPCVRRRPGVRRRGSRPRRRGGGRGRHGARGSLAAPGRRAPREPGSGRAHLLPGHGRPTTWSSRRSTSESGGSPADRSEPRHPPRHRRPRRRRPRAPRRARRPRARDRVRRRRGGDPPGPRPWIPPTGRHGRRAA